MSAHDRSCARVASTAAASAEGRLRRRMRHEIMLCTVLVAAALGGMVLLGPASEFFAGFMVGLLS